MSWSPAVIAGVVDKEGSLPVVAPTRIGMPSLRRRSILR